MLGTIHTRRADWVNAENAWRRAFELHDRIAQKEGFGPPHHEDLWHWAYAASEIGAPDTARVVTRARAEAELYVEKWGEGRLILAASLMLERRLRQGDVAAGIAHRVRENACEVKELKYYSDGRTLDASYYLPTTV